MKMQFYFYRYDYMAFYLMMLSVVNIIKNNITENIVVINNYSELDFDNNTVIMFLGDLQHNNYNSKIILINPEHYQNLNPNILQFINKKENYYIWDFSSTNIREIKKTYTNIKTYYLPLLYNPYLELYYKQTITRSIEYQNKEIDILFMGTMNNRRQKILDELKKSYKVKIIVIEDRLSNREIFDLIENSKLVLNLFYYEVFVFDYYRNTLLLSNNVLMVSETPYNIDTISEPNLKDFETNLLVSNYDNIINTVKKTLEQTPEEINRIKNKTYQWFKKHDMTEHIIDFFADYASNNPPQTDM
jgi:hypothetical protein